MIKDIEDFYLNTNQAKDAKPEDYTRMRRCKSCHNSDRTNYKSSYIHRRAKFEQLTDGERLQLSTTPDDALFNLVNIYNLKEKTLQNWKYWINRGHP